MQGNLEQKDVLKVSKRFMKESFEVNWHGKPLSGITLLSMKDAINLPDRIVSKSSKDGEFIPSLFDFVLRVELITSYLLVDVPSDPEELYKIVYYTDLFNVVLNNCNKGQVDSIISSCGVDPRVVRG